MIFAGYRANKWLHGDLILRSWLLLCALTGNTGREGGGVQTTQLPRRSRVFSRTSSPAWVRGCVSQRISAYWDYAKLEWPG